MNFQKSSSLEPNPFLLEGGGEMGFQICCRPFKFFFALLFLTIFFRKSSCFLSTPVKWQTPPKHAKHPTNQARAARPKMCTHENCKSSLGPGETVSGKETQNRTWELQWQIPKDAKKSRVRIWRRIYQCFNTFLGLQAIIVQISTQQGI